MNPFQIIGYIVFILPLLIISEAYEMLMKNVPKEKRIPRVLLTFIVLLSIVAIVLWLKGYR
jgi:hypothetical protein